MPPVTGPIFCSVSTRAASAALCMAATTRSSRVSTSSGSTAFGSILTARELAGAGDRDGDQPTAGRAGHLGLGQLRLRRGDLLLHLLRLLQHLLHVRLSTWAHGMAPSRTRCSAVPSLVARRPVPLSDVDLVDLLGAEPGH